MLTPITAQDHGALQSLVLVADDDEHLRSLIVEVLNLIGIGALVASDGAEAVELVAERGAALLCAILDVRMPVLDGLGAARAIRATAPNLPLIMMSSEFTPDYRQQFAPLGIAHVLDKPFRIRELIAAVHTIVVGRPAAPKPVSDGAAEDLPPEDKRQKHRQH